MSRIDACFTQLRSERRRALIPFVTAGDPMPETTVPLMHALVRAGANILELGIPFSDPIADGPVIQKASERALAGGMTLRRALAMVTEFRARDGATPVVLMGYLNPFEVMGYTDFAQAAAQAGVDGVITVDLPPEEAETFVQSVRGHGIDPIFLLAPTTSDERITKICRFASGFVYYVSLKGVTGASHLDVEAVSRRVSHIKRITKIPVGVGFGIRDAKTSAAIAAISDAVVVGALLVGRIESLLHAPGRISGELSGLVAGMRRAMDETTGARP